MTKELTSLDKLKATIARVKYYRALPLSEQLHNAFGFSAAVSAAWRAAFEWRHRTSFQHGEIDEGMRLIKELSR